MRGAGLLKFWLHKSRPLLFFSRWLRIVRNFFIYVLLGLSSRFLLSISAAEPMTSPSASPSLTFDESLVQLYSLDELADFVPERDVKFLLFTRFSPDKPEEIRLDDSSALKSSFFNPKRPTRFLIHGWIDSARGELCVNGRIAYLQKGEFNVFAVDWSLGASTLNYLKARSNVFEVGPLLARYLEFLRNDGGLEYNETYLIGHSLGAHIAGIAGKNVKRQLHTIIGLDAAGPFFFTNRPQERIDAGDAGYVEIIHTSLQGFQKPLGFADFIVNGGKHQPGCNIFGSCSHMRSIAYWVESINTEVGFWANPIEGQPEIWDDLYDYKRKSIKMGGEPSNYGKARGVYTVETHNECPFAMGPITSLES